mmetsp:Transcript_48/g.91  ORF Transcript_48/g.91 Transcript_48/m.91 type:complete len:597 (-) Transcript_48:58-1848(-)
MTLMRQSEIRRRRVGVGGDVSASTTVSLTFGMQQEEEEDDDDDEKIHVPGHWYRIYSIDSLCHTFVILSIIILAVDRITVISAQSRSSSVETSHNNEDAAFVVEGDGTIVDIGTATNRRSRAAVQPLDFQLNLEYLKRKDDLIEFNEPPSLDVDLISEIYNGTVIINNELPRQFSSFYNGTPDLNDNGVNVNVLEELDMEGHIYTYEDFEDDDLVDAYEYLQEYFSFDDDFNRSPHIEEDGTRSSLCQKPSWYRQHHPTCNKLHEVPILNEEEYVGYYIASGGYRDVFSVYDGDAVLKIALFERKYDTDLFEMIRIDSLAMDLLTTSPRVVNIYSHCGLSVHVETMNGPSVEELVMPSQREGYEDELPPMLNATAKLNMALEMAEALADLHGYQYGPFAHFDIQIVQFLLDENLRPKMSDFNRAEPMMWNEKDKAYCKGWMGKASGSVRSPEEYAEEEPIDFNVDVYSFGNVLYTMITGKDPYGDDRETAATLSVEGIPPKVDATIRGRSFAEASLANVMDKCFEYFPEKRISIFQVVSLLRDALDLNAKLEGIPVSTFDEHEFDKDEHEHDEDESEDDEDEYYDEEDGEESVSWW